MAAAAAPGAGESIYNWIKEVPPPPPKPPMHHSAHDGTLPPYRASSSFVGAAVRKAHGVIGREVKATVRPDAFLRAHEKTASVVDPTTLRESMRRTPPRGCRSASGPIPRACTHASSVASSWPPSAPLAAAARFTRADPPRKAAVPKRGEAPLHGLSSGKDFVTTNAVEAILAGEGGRGCAHHLNHSRLCRPRRVGAHRHRAPPLPMMAAAVPKRKAAAEPDWLAKADYGKVPEYLATVKAEIEAEHEYIQSLLDQRQVCVRTRAHAASAAWSCCARMPMCPMLTPARHLSPPSNRRWRRRPPVAPACVS